jgi:hypothetical protein
MFPGAAGVCDLADTHRGLRAHMPPSLCKLLGQAIDVVLPNRSRQDDLLFVQQLLRRLCGAEEGGREAWTHLVWQVRACRAAHEPTNRHVMPCKGLLEQAKNCPGALQHMAST